MSDPDPLPTSSSEEFLIDISVKSSNWTSVNFSVHEHCKKVMKAVVVNVLGGGYENKSVEISLLLADDERLHNLNKEFRNKDSTTNVLSFPFYKIQKDTINSVLDSNNYMFLGDIAISFERIMSESMEQEKTFEEYFSHILIHGLLHLFGYDHILDEEAEIMEKLEIKIMNEVGYKYKPIEFNDQMVSQNL